MSDKKRLRGMLHSDDTVIEVACDMEPSAWIHKSGVPALEDIVWIYQLGFPSRKNIPCNSNHKLSKKSSNHQPSNSKFRLASQERRKEGRKEAIAPFNSSEIRKCIQKERIFWSFFLLKLLFLLYAFILPSELQRTAAMAEANDRKKTKFLKVAMFGVGEAW